MSANDELQAHTCEKMLEFYGNVANNVAQSNSQDLTKQWENGELENGKKYWITYKNSEPFIATFNLFKAYFDYWKFIDGYKEYQDESGEACVKVLAPVPSYEQWQAKEEEILQLKQKVTSKNKRLQTYKKRIDEISKLASDRNILIKKLKKDIKYGFAVDDVVMDRMDKLREENQQLKETLSKIKANGHYPDRISRLKSRVVALSEENRQVKDLLKACKEFVSLAGYLFLDNADDNTIEQCNKLLAEINEVLK